MGRVGRDVGKERPGIIGGLQHKLLCLLRNHVCRQGRRGRGGGRGGTGKGPAHRPTCRGQSRLDLHSVTEPAGRTHAFRQRRTGQSEIAPAFKPAACLWPTLVCSPGRCFAPTCAVVGLVGAVAARHPLVAHNPLDVVCGGKGRQGRQAKSRGMGCSSGRWACVRGGGLRGSEPAAGWLPPRLSPQSLPPRPRTERVADAKPAVEARRHSAVVAQLVTVQEPAPGGATAGRQGWGYGAALNKQAQQARSRVALPAKRRCSQQVGASTSPPAARPPSGSCGYLVLLTCQ